MHHRTVMSFRINVYYNTIYGPNYYLLIQQNNSVVIGSNRWNAGNKSCQTVTHIESAIDYVINRVTNSLQIHREEQLCLSFQAMHLSHKSYRQMDLPSIHASFEFPFSNTRRYISPPNYLKRTICRVAVGNIQRGISPL